MEILVSLACLVQHLSYTSLCLPPIFSHNYQFSSSLPCLLEASALEGYMSELPTNVSHSIWSVGNTGMSSRYFFNTVLGSSPVVIRHLTRSNLRERGSFYLMVGGISPSWWEAWQQKGEVTRHCVIGESIPH